MLVILISSAIVCILFILIIIYLRSKKYYGLTLDLTLLFYLILCVCSGFIIGWIFYRDRMLALVCSCLALFTIKYFKQWQRERRHARVIDEFLSINRMLISELHAGKSVAKAYRDIYQRLVEEDTKYHANMRDELKNWCAKLDAGQPITDVLKQFNDKYDDSRVRQFYTMMEVAVRNGASLLEVIEMTDRVIKDRLQIEREVKILISEKKLEQLVISCSPLCLLLFMQNLSYSFVAPLYETIGGRIFMSMGLLVFVGCFFWSRSMVKVDI